MDRSQFLPLRAELIRDEGVRLKPYRDSQGKLTIGTGHNLDDVGISLEESDLLLLHDIEHTLEALDAELPTWRTLNPIRQRVIVNMAFNLGFRPTNMNARRALCWIRPGQHKLALARIV
jgi:lysozyme